MRHSILATTLLAALGSVSFTISAGDVDAAEIALLRQQLAALQAQLQALEERISMQPAGDREPAPATAQPIAEAARVETRGGIKVTSADKQFEASVSGRIHFDAYGFDRDLASAVGTSEFRRARLTLGGKLYGWDYRMEQDFAAGTNLEGLRDVYIARGALGGKFTIGQFKPYRSMEELTSSNDVLMMERPFASASGLYSGRQFQQGVGYLRSGGTYTLGVGAFNLRSAGDPRNEGLGAAARVTYAPVNTGSRTLHLGVSASTENTSDGNGNLSASVRYAGRRGPSQGIATTSDSVNSVGIEAAAASGPFFVQSEYARARFERPLGSDQEVETWYVMGSWMINGGQRTYKPATGVFASPKVADKGLWELTARYDTIDSKDIAGLEVRSWILGLNYYINPNMRVMFNYTQGENGFTDDQTAQYALRTQLSF